MKPEALYGNQSCTEVPFAEGDGIFPWPLLAPCNAKHIALGSPGQGNSNLLCDVCDSACPARPVAPGDGTGVGGNHRTGVVNSRAMPSCNIQISSRYISLFHYFIYKATGKKTNKLLVFQYIIETRRH